MKSLSSKSYHKASDCLNHVQKKIQSVFDYRFHLNVTVSLLRYNDSSIVQMGNDVKDTQLTC